MIRIINSAGKTKVEMMGDIGDSFWGEGWTLERFKNEVETMDISELDVEIQSMGGDVLEAFAIYDAIREMPQKVTTRIIGSTASAGTVIAMAGDSREITPNSRFLIHNSSTLTAGDKEEHEKNTDQLKSIDKQLVSLYKKATGKRDNELIAQMDKGTWMTSEEALRWGFVNRISDAKFLNNKIETMDKEVLELLNVETEDEVIDAITEMRSANERLEGEKTEALERLQQYEAAEKEAAQAAVSNYLAQAVEDKKISAESVDKWAKMAEADFECVRSTIDAIQVSGSLADEIVQDEDKRTPEQTFWDNWKSGAYKKDPEAAKRDYRAAFGKDLKL
jgi:ATP-dependent protease ClpP protease subunit